MPIRVKLHYVYLELSPRQYQLEKNCSITQELKILQIWVKLSLFARTDNSLTPKFPDFFFLEYLIVTH